MHTQTHARTPMHVHVRYLNWQESFTRREIVTSVDFENKKWLSSMTEYWKIYGQRKRANGNTELSQL